MDQLHRRGYPAEKTWLVLNRSGLKGGLSQRDIQDRLHVKVSHAVPDDQALATYSVNRGVPLIISHPRSAVSRSVKKLSQRLSRELAVENGRFERTLPNGQLRRLVGRAESG